MGHVPQMRQPGAIQPAGEGGGLPPVDQPLQRDEAAARIVQRPGLDMAAGQQALALRGQQIGEIVGEAAHRLT